MKNYLRLKTWSFTNAGYVFVDTVQMFYKKIFLDEGIKPRRIREYHKQHSDLKLIECIVHKQDVKKLEEIFPLIRKKALLLGYRDYDEMCEKLCIREEVK